MASVTNKPDEAQPGGDSSRDRGGGLADRLESAVAGAAPGIRAHDAGPQGRQDDAGAERLALAAALVEDTQGLRVEMPLFEGPLDLLLHIIKKQRLDIFDIPVSEITARYLEYVEALQTLNLDLAGEFLVMAATLAHLKSVTLLPPDEAEGSEETLQIGQDPRAALVRRLLDFQRYRDAAVSLFELDLLGRDVFTRGARDRKSWLEAGDDDELPFSDTDVLQLLDAFSNALRRAGRRLPPEIQRERFSIRARMMYIVERLRETPSGTFTGLLSKEPSAAELVVTFLAILELAKMNMVHAHQVEPGAEIHLTSAVEASFDAEDLPDVEDETAAEAAPETPAPTAADEDDAGIDISEIEKDLE